MKQKIKTHFCENPICPNHNLELNDENHYHDTDADVTGSICGILRTYPYAIIKQRTKKGLTQADLAKKIGTKQSAISRLERGTYNPSLAFLKKIAKALDKELHVCFQ